MWIDQQPIVTAGASRFVWTPVLDQTFRLVDRFGELYSAGIRVGSYFDVPRGTCPLGKVDERTSQPISAINCTLQLRDDQPRCVNESLGWLKGDKNHVLEAPTGWGKTIGGTAIACGMGQKTLIVVTKNDLKQNWVEAIKLAGWGNSIGLAQGQVQDWKGKQFVIGMVQSLIRPDKYPPEFFRYFGMVIFDEVHRMAAECFVEACRLFSAKYRLGLSATPKRSDGKENLLKWHIGPTLVKGDVIPMSPKVLVKKTGWWIPKRRVWNQFAGIYEEADIPHSPGRMMLVTKAMAKDARRNAIIVDFVRQSYASGRITVVMSDLIEDHLNLLFPLIAKHVPAQEIDFYIGGKSAVELKIAATKRVILSTYAMTAEGTDYPDWDTLVPATPRANIKQAAGRVLRKKPGKKQPVILDLVDANPIFQGFFLSREKQYYSVKGEIVRMP